MPLDAITCLSDEDENDKSVPKPSRLPVPKRRPRKGFKTRRPMIPLDPKMLRSLISSKCGCKSDCFSPFREKLSLWDRWLQHRKLLHAMKKLEKDQRVRDLDLALVFTALYPRPAIRSLLQCLQ